MKVSVNILTWNTYKTLVESLNILKKDLKDIEHEIIIVDNGSNDGCEKLATIKNEKNLGISVGKNQGIDESIGEYVFFLDGDIVPVPNSINCLIKHMDENPECDAIGFLPNKFSRDRNRGGIKNHESYCEKLDPIKEHNGHCIYYGIYRRTMFELGIRLDESYGPGYGWEDLDFFMQMKEKGITQWTAGINHLCGKYYHEINSSIKQMGFEEYMSSSLRRSKIFKSKWETAHVIGH